MLDDLNAESEISMAVQKSLYRSVYSPATKCILMYPKPELLNI